MVDILPEVGPKKGDRLCRGLFILSVAILSHLITGYIINLFVHMTLFLSYQGNMDYSHGDSSWQVE